MEIEFAKYLDILNQNEVLARTVQGKPYRIKVLSNIIVHSVKEILELACRLNNVNPEISFGNYDNIVQDSSQCVQSDLVIVAYDLFAVTRGLSSWFENLDEQGISALRNKIFFEIDLVTKNLSLCPSVLFNSFSSSCFVNGNPAESKLDVFCLELNQYLEKKKTTNFNLVNLDKLFLTLGVVNAVDLRLYQSSKAPYTLGFFKKYVTAILPVILRNTGKLKKAVIFDCDNTLWKGIIGEDGFTGIEMSPATADGSYFNQVQQIAVNLSRCGIIVGLCSRNNEADVMELLERHPDMALRNEHIVIREINWQDKVTNLRSIAEKLNIGLDSILFVDDSSFEITFIKEQLPEVLTLQVPAETYKYPDLLMQYAYRYFNLSSTAEDREKTEIYKQQFQRESARQHHESLEQYLASLEISVVISRDDPSQVARVAQLTQKTNQFNLTTRRYTETQILQFIESNSDFVFTARVADKFGDSGLTALAIIRTDPEKPDSCTIDTLLMSCRIIGRNIEFSFIDYIAGWLQRNRYSTIHADYIPTPKNSQVSGFFETLGFHVVGEASGTKRYSIDCSGFKPREIGYIEVIET